MGWRRSCAPKTFRVYRNLILAQKENYNRNVVDWFRYEERQVLQQIKILFIDPIEMQMN